MLGTLLGTGNKLENKTGNPALQGTSIPGMEMGYNPDRSGMVRTLNGALSWGSLQTESTMYVRCREIRVWGKGTQYKIEWRQVFIDPKLAELGMGEC